MNGHDRRETSTLDVVLDADRTARAAAQTMIRRISRASAESSAA